MGVSEMMLYCGTSGFSFKEWKGPFYPEKLPANEMLAFYAKRLPAVEINNTFYRMPTRKMLEGWAAQVPGTFRFAIKAPRRITHVKQLKDCSEEAGHLFETLGALGSRLGVVLFQLPPHARADVDRLVAFLELVPRDLPVAFEFRHTSWDQDAVRVALAERAAAWVTADNDGDEPFVLPKTAPHAYLRLRAEAYDDEALAGWKERCEAFERAFVFFKHEDGGAGPAYAARMMAT
ncbi:MAG TPA: DUF72 domain-containing protein [Gammaproteobacteria bacterium]|nr:DUF72 domain-containing protein [Gammaproteobacteria bacterium]